MGGGHRQLGAKQPLLLRRRKIQVGDWQRSYQGSGDCQAEVAKPESETRRVEVELGARVRKVISL